MDSLSEQQQQASEKPIINITGEKVALGPIRRDQVPLFYRWANDFNVLRTLHIPRPSTFEENLAFFERDVEDEKRRTVVHFTVYDRASLTPIGRVDLEEINHRDRRAEFGIEIGEPDYRGRGYGTEATRLMLDYAFTGLGLHNIGLYTWEYNLAAQAVYKKAGFREVGRRRQAKFMGGKLWDIIYMDCLSTEFVSPVLSKIMVPDEVRS
ncbi:GNAT family N-acetyltransferase [Dictyobacter formicarum]|uniref:N-acetyltransferase n=1 Tax=Dictyobacter formicarum TaxID=2778368 RepID=A0ABQ3VEU6_9CHLR|nr:GNAT family protein [Dictyobacter formicarum]GHO83913.1 N-acetyltransferase [Dictyobacter formicarum]